MKNIILPFSLILILALSACHRDGSNLILPAKAGATPSSGNKPGSDCNPNLITFTDVKPVFEKNCKLCHAKGGPLPDWSDYQTSLTMKDRLNDRVLIKKDMPMGQPLAKEDLALIAAWLNDGALEKSCTSNDSATSPDTPAPAPSPETPAPSDPAQPDPTPAPEQPAPVPEQPTNPAPEPPTPELPVPSEPLPAPSFQKNIKPLVKTYCVMCHAADGPLPDWNDPTIIAQKKQQLWDRVVVKKDMPMGLKMTPEEVEIFKRWLEAGAPTSP